MAILLQTEAVERARLIAGISYTVDLDLTLGDTEFGSRTVVRFSCSEPGASTFIDLKAVSVESITLNGNDIHPSAISDGRLTLTQLQQANELSVTARMAYTRDAQGLHRAVDPADEKAYVYGMSFLDAAPQIFPCFDQPDLKAGYDLTVTAPQDWVVAGNSAAKQTSPGRWEFETSKPLATYFFTICAGPYETVRDEHRGIPLALHARASLGQDLRRHAPQMLDVTKQGLDYFEDLFGIDYPWGEYHQFFVPEFNAGAMENPGCVTFRDQYIFRGSVGRAEIMQRSNTILHEMAHMWFGDLVSMKWWDDLWLNESFAEYMAHRACSAATEFDDAWVDFGISRKNWGYAADRAPSTHPIAGNAADDTDSALTNFDGISYAKGCSALRQLALYVGDDAFVGGVRDYLRDHSYGNATLADFLDAISAHTDVDLDAWSKGWLETAGTDEIAVVVDGDPIGVVEAVRTTPEAHPADRPHMLDIAGFCGGKEVWRTPVFTLGATSGEQTPLTGLERPKLLVPNASDLTWTIPVFDDNTLAAMPDELPKVEDPQVRQVVWAGLLNGMALSTVDPQTVLAVFEASFPTEENESLRHWTARLVRRRLGYFLPDAERQEATERIAVAATVALDAADAERAVTPGRLLAATSSHEGLLRRWVAAEDLPDALAGDLDVRWTALTRLAQLGHADDAAIDAFAAQDRTMAGEQNALRAKAVRPTPEAKEWAWTQLESNSSLSNYEALAIAETIFVAPSSELVRPHVERYFRVLPKLADRLGEFASQKIAAAAFPVGVTEQATSDAAQEALRSGRMTANVRRAIVDGTAELDEALASLQRFGR
ncbi:aminopeptidase N [Yimella sp. RIT 621]|uniref:aminopeptidase N n=1 Tax=Yimella sp. RIT 621 TaxID=2510323 RepID=UPI00101D6185|nr:aminopeptidase N [Yimella sp. RIT 621]RYG78174.1 aminopeptidase N [Yimella sp. RIT 621]